MRNKATERNKDLDLRRFGKNLFTKALNSTQENSAGSDLASVFFGNRKVVGFVDNTHLDCYRIVGGGEHEPTEALLFSSHPIIPASEVKNYVISKYDSELGSARVLLSPIYEYDEKIDPTLAEEGFQNFHSGDIIDSIAAFEIVYFPESVYEGEFYPGAIEIQQVISGNWVVKLLLEESEKDYLMFINNY